MRERVKPDEEEADRCLGRPLRALFERGTREGTLRSDLAPEAQLRLFTNIITGALHANLQRELGIEQTAATLTSFFLDGAFPRREFSGK